MARTEAAPERLPAPPRLLIDELQRTARSSFAEAAAADDVRAAARWRPRSGDGRDDDHVSRVAGRRLEGARALPAGDARSKSVSACTTSPRRTSIGRRARCSRTTQVSWKQTLGPKESLPNGRRRRLDEGGRPHGEAGHHRVAPGRRAIGSRTRSRTSAAGKTFASAYHIKVAVRDRKSFWLSSGNWQSSNQPDIDFLDRRRRRRV